MVYQIVAAGSRGQSAYGGRLVAKVFSWILSIEHELYMFMRYYKGISTKYFATDFVYKVSRHCILSNRRNVSSSVRMTRGYCMIEDNF